VLNLQRSKPMDPAARTLWIIRDDGKHLTWVLVLTDADGSVRLNTWDGPYNGPPALVGGTPMRAQIRSRAAGTMQIHGEIEGEGAFLEDCVLAEDGRTLVCTGEVTTADGVQTYLEEFDWAGPSPG
jgi:hypothetical protein